MTITKKECYVCNHKGRFKVRSVANRTLWVCARIHVYPVPGFRGYSPARKRVV